MQIRVPKILDLLGVKIERAELIDCLHAPAIVPEVSPHKLVTPQFLAQIGDSVLWLCARIHAFRLDRSNYETGRWLARAGSNLFLARRLEVILGPNGVGFLGGMGQKYRATFFEAIIGAMFFDSGPNDVMNFVQRHILEHVQADLDQHREDEPPESLIDKVLNASDAGRQVQTSAVEVLEEFAAILNALPEYRLSGPPMSAAGMYAVVVDVLGVQASGDGTTIAAAKEEAANQALHILNINYSDDS